MNYSASKEAVLRTLSGPIKELVFGYSSVISIPVQWGEQDVFKLNS
jgi:hypothetical protein